MALSILVTSPTTATNDYRSLLFHLLDLNEIFSSHTTVFRFLCRRVSAHQNRIRLSGTLEWTNVSTRLFIFGSLLPLEFSCTNNICHSTYRIWHLFQNFSNIYSIVLNDLQHGKKHLDTSSVFLSDVKQLALWKTSVWKLIYRYRKLLCLQPPL